MEPDSRPLTFLDAAVVSEAFLHHEQRKVDREPASASVENGMKRNLSLIGHTVETYDLGSPGAVTVSYQEWNFYRNAAVTHL